MQKGNWYIGISSLRSKIQLYLGDLATLTWRDLMENIENAYFLSVGAPVWQISGHTRTCLSTKQCYYILPGDNMSWRHRLGEWGKISMPLISAATRWGVQLSPVKHVGSELIWRGKRTCTCAWESRNGMEMSSVADKVDTWPVLCNQNLHRWSISQSHFTFSGLTSLKLPHFGINSMQVGYQAYIYWLRGNCVALQKEKVWSASAVLCVR